MPRATTNRRAATGARLAARSDSSEGSTRARVSYRAPVTSRDATHTCTSSVISSNDVNDLYLCASAGNRQSPDAGSKIEPLRTCRPGIHEQLVPDSRDEWAMRMAEDDDIGVVASGKICRGRTAN